MVQKKQKTSLIAKLILLGSIIAVLCIYLTPMFFINFLSDGTATIWGFKAIFGGSPDQVSSITITYDFNWRPLVISIIFLLIGVTTFLIGPKAKGYYIFSSIVFLGLAIFIFYMKSIVIRPTIHVSTSSLAMNRAHLGVGPWASGIISSLSCLACIIEYRLAKLR
ncbi:unknown [Firmicutes bacterium CAG:449]|nr:unknown [Firmicutes bacterium CAG:449]